MLILLLCHSQGYPLCSNAPLPGPVSTASSAWCTPAGTASPSCPKSFSPAVSPSHCASTACRRPGSQAPCLCPHGRGVRGAACSPPHDTLLIGLYGQGAQKCACETRRILLEKMEDPPL